MQEYRPPRPEYKFPQQRVYYMPVGSEMTPAALRDAIAWHKLFVRDTLEPLGRMYEVDSEIFHKPPREDGKPDNRISAAHCKIVTDEFVGYLTGIPIQVTSNEDAVQEYVTYLGSATDTDENTTDLVQDACVFGRGYEMFYNDEFGEIGAAVVSPLTSFIIYDDSILHKPLFFVRYGVDSDGVERGSYSDNQSVVHFVEDGGEYHFLIDEIEMHSFPGVPATEYVLCRQRLGLYEPGVSLENAFNAALSEKSNDIQSFADTYLKILGAPVDENEIPRIARRRILAFQGDGSGQNPDVGFLERPTADGLEEHFLDRVEKLFFRACQVPDLSDEHFGTASGQALKWRLLGMDNLAAGVKRKIAASLRRRYKLIFGNPASLTHGIHADDWKGLSFHFTRNLPSNVTDEATTAQTLDGIVSKQTQLSVLSIVDDVQAEVERIEAERQSEIDAVSSYGVHDHDEK